jgi:hypothetical protein
MVLLSIHSSLLETMRKARKEDEEEEQEVGDEDSRHSNQWNEINQLSLCLQSQLSAACLSSLILTDPIEVSQRAIDPEARKMQEQ